MYKEALKNGFYTVLTARDAYREATAQEGGMNAELVARFVRVQTLLLAPIAPHVAEHLWTSLLGEKESIQLARFPTLDAAVDHSIIDAAVYVRTVTKEIRDAEISFAKKKGKGKGGPAAFDPAKPKAVKIYVANGFPAWQEYAVEIVKGAFDESSGKVDDEKIRTEVLQKGLGKDKKLMPFIAQFKVCLSISFFLQLALTDVVAHE